ncbi:hypothetical protein DHEL01_v205051 [Diaporthe helianthi]|uniref:Uncharacterized protein n=1 Tax=Diaporthe helianthi TaxID=158607 RepID=A0A2P5I200_DIAHE|nr:hypothetical protein DHEL01_v205051 [Diaporthe helianthi]
MSGIVQACSALLCCDIQGTCTPRYTTTHMHDAPLPPKPAQRRCLIALDGPSLDSTGLDSPTRLEQPAPPSSFLTPHCLQSIGPGQLDRSIVLYRAVAVCPRSVTAVPVAAGLCKGLPARACVSVSFRLTDFLHGSLPWPLCRPPTVSLVFSLFPLPPQRLPNGAHGLQYRQSTTLLLQAGPFLVSGDPVVPPYPHPTPETGYSDPGLSSNKR